MTWLKLKAFGFADYQVATGTNANGVNVELGAVSKPFKQNYYNAFFSNGRVKLKATRGSVYGAKNFVETSYQARGG